MVAVVFVLEDIAKLVGESGVLRVLVETLVEDEVPSTFEAVNDIVYVVFAAKLVI
jgi:hypothetical protein